MVPAALPRHHGGMSKLLVVEDSELVRNRLVALLRELPGVEQVQAAATLSQALDAVYEAPPNLLILDLHLPDGNALQVLGVFKNIAPHMRIAMLSNDASEFTRARCLKGGADAFFDKSTEFEDALAWTSRLGRASPSMRH